MTISAKIIKDSISSNGGRITTFELEYPRFIHAELLTHRLFSRNAASSRAIPISKMIDQVWDNPAMPAVWGLNQSGMQAKLLHNHPTTCKWAWKAAARLAVVSAKSLQALGLHKQIVNRVLEPFQIMKTIVTATEFDNFFWLRCHEDAQPEIHILADLMFSGMEKSKPKLLKVGEWHLPYVSSRRCLGEELKYYVGGTTVTLEEAKKVSASCCAQVSYRLLDDSLDKALKIYNQLVTMSPVHASPFEHLATPMNGTEPEYDEHLCDLFDCGETHIDSNHQFWSGNFKGWIQYRQLINNNVCTKYDKD